MPLRLQTQEERAQTFGLLTRVGCAFCETNMGSNQLTCRNGHMKIWETKLSHVLSFINFMRWAETRNQNSCFVSLRMRRIQMTGGFHDSPHEKKSHEVTRIGHELIPNTRQIYMMNYAKHESYDVKKIYYTNTKYNIIHIILILPDSAQIHYRITRQTRFDIILAADRQGEVSGDGWLPDRSKFVRQFR